MESDSGNKLLKEIYYDPKDPGSFSGVEAEVS